MITIQKHARAEAWMLRMDQLRGSIGKGAMLLLLLGSSATAEPVTASFTGSNGRTLLYRYSLEGSPESDASAGILLYFHGENSGTQQSVSGTFFPLVQAQAQKHGLIPVAVASPDPPGYGVRRWQDADEPLIHEFLQTGLESAFSFSRNRIVFYGQSRGTSFLAGFLRTYGTSYGGGFYAACGFDGSVVAGYQVAWDLPPGFRNRFRIVVQAGTGDFLHSSAVQTYLYYKYSIGLETFGDLSAPRGHCEGGSVSEETAIGWILGTREIESGEAEDPPERRIPLRTERWSEQDSGELAPASPGRRTSASFERPRCVHGPNDNNGRGRAFWLPATAQARPQVVDREVGVRKIEFFAGAAPQGYTAEVDLELGRSTVAVDAVGNVYVADADNFRVVRINEAGTVTTIAGTGTFASANLHSGNVPATEVEIRPSGVAVDAVGNVYINDAYRRVDRVDAVTGVITTIAGTGGYGYSGDGGPATEALVRISDLTVDAAGNVYIADAWGSRVRRVDAATGVITTIAGTGKHEYAGDGGPAIEAGLSVNGGVAVDGSGNVYVGDGLNYRVRRIDAVTGVITTIAGTGNRGYPSGGLATEAPLISVEGVDVDATGNVLIVFGTRIGRVDAVTGEFTWVVGNLYSHQDYIGTASTANFPQVQDTALDSVGNLFITTKERPSSVVIVPVRNRMKFIDVPVAAGGEVVALELAEDGFVTHCGTQVFAGARVAVRNGGIYALDQRADGTVVARQVTLSEPIAVPESLAMPGTNRISTIVPPEAGLHNPNALAVDTVGNVYVTDTGNNRVLRIDALGVISTFAGTVDPGYSGDGGPATQARMFNPDGLAVDGAGNVFVSTERRVRRIDAVTGVITTIAGTGSPGFSGDGGPATEAQFSAVAGGLAADRAGNVYVADLYNDRVRRIDAATGIITTIAGAGTEVVPQLDFPNDVAVDPSGNVYVAGTFNNRVFRITPEGALTETYFQKPRTLAVDAAGNLYVAGDSPRGRVLRIDAEGSRTWVVGTGGEPGHTGDGGPASEATLYYANSVAVDAAGNLYVGDRDRIRFVSTAPFEVGVPMGSSGETAWLSVSKEFRVTRHGRPVVTGSRLVDSAGETYAVSLAASGNLRATLVEQKQLLSLRQGQRPVEFVQDESGAWSIGGRSVRSGYRHVQGGRAYILDVVDGRWRVATHAMRTVAGNSSVEDGILATATTLYSPSSVATDSAGNLYIADRENNRVRHIDATGMITTFAGTGDRGFSGDGGLAVAAQLDRPSAVAVDAAGQVYVADSGNQRIRRIDVGGGIATIAGTGSAGFGGDGMLGTSAALDNPIGLATDAVGNVYVADSGNQRIRRIDLQGVITTVAGTGEPGYGGDGAAATEALLDGPTGVAADTAGNLFVADYRNQRIRRIDAAGVITTVAGTGESGYGGDGAAATAARLDGPIGVAAQEPGYVYVAELSGHRVRRIGAVGIITTIAGTGEPFDRGDHGPASEAQFSHALGDVAVDSNGTVYVTDSYDHRVRRIDPTGRVATFAGSDLDGFHGDGGPAVEAQLSSPGGVAVDATGNVYVADTWNNRIRRVGASGRITTIAGTGKIGIGREDSPAIQSPLHRPEKLTVDAEGNVYVLDSGNHRVRVVTPSGLIRTVAGSGSVEDVNFPYILDFFSGFDARRAPLFGVSDLAVDTDPSGNGTLYLAEFFGGVLLRAVSLGSDHRIDRVFSDSTRGVVRGMALDADGNIYIADDLGILVRAQNGMISTVADARENGFSVGAIHVDRSGSIWFTDPVHRRIRVLEPVN